MHARAHARAHTHTNTHTHTHNLMTRLFTALLHPADPQPAASLGQHRRKHQTDLGPAIWPRVHQLLRHTGARGAALQVWKLPPPHAFLILYTLALSRPTGCLQSRLHGLFDSGRRLNCHVSSDCMWAAAKACEQRPCVSRNSLFLPLSQFRSMEHC
jgi:hypothetical protein